MILQNTVDMMRIMQEPVSAADVAFMCPYGTTGVMRFGNYHLDLKRPPEQVLARHRHGRVKASERDIARALTGNWREEHLFVLAQALAMFDSLAQRIRECDAKISGRRATG